MTAPQGRDRITAEDVGEALGISPKIVSPQMVRDLNSPKLRRLVVRKCVEQWWPENSGPECEEELWATRDGFVDALCGPEETPHV
jgi:hypothetical protein